ncbi:MAG TPA: 50S ribosomal protein L21 [Calditrichae bacterium]|nr:50S ribosomal protein L21 [Calditrichia bacterium]HFB67916.1 50S ribosomal protein L21 [Calditrichia bacterium]
MYAIVEIAGKQFRVEKDAQIKVPLLHHEVGEKVEFDKVLFVNDDSGVKVGAPVVEGAKVSAEVLEHGREKKIIVFKKKRRKGYRKKRGHRQQFTRIKIENISVG